MTPTPSNSSESKIPAGLKKALAASPSIKTLWDDLTPVSRRDFIRWIASAKQQETRDRRVTIALSKLASGQRRPCCYAVVPMPLYTALGTNPKAKATWSTLTPDERRDLVDFLDEAKTSEAKKARIEKICASLAKGKRRV